MPLFGRYLFVDNPHETWRAIVDCRHVGGLIMQNDRPGVVPPGVIAAIKARCDAQRERGGSVIVLGPSRQQI